MCRIPVLVRPSALLAWITLTLSCSNEAINATKGTQKSIWRKVNTFKRAIAFMISGGESERYRNEDMRLLLEQYLSAGTGEYVLRYTLAGTNTR